MFYFICCFSLMNVILLRLCLTGRVRKTGLSKAPTHPTINSFMLFITFQIQHLCARFFLHFVCALHEHEHIRLEALYKFEKYKFFRTKELIDGNIYPEDTNLCLFGIKKWHPFKFTPTLFPVV